MVDDVAQLDIVDSVAPRRPCRCGSPSTSTPASRMGRQHVGPKRSPLYDATSVTTLARAIGDRPGFRLVGAMTYEGQVAGVPDDVPTQRAKSLVVRA